MCSDISMPAEPRRRRFPWRALGVLVLLSATGIYSYDIYTQTRDQLNGEKQGFYLETAGPLAESFEDAQLEAASIDPRQAMATIIAAFFPEEPQLAAVRVWDPSLTLTCEVTRRQPEVTYAGDAGTLPPLEISTAVQAANMHLQDQDWVDLVARLRLLEREQNDLIAEIAPESGSELTVRARKALAEHQQATLELARTSNTDKILDAAIDDMMVVVKGLRQDESPASLAAAMETASTDLTAALTTFRASADDLPSLPAELSAVAPKPAGWWMRIWPELRGERVLIPIFTPSMDDKLAAHTGYAEFIFYNHPGEVLDALKGLGWRKQAPAIVMLLLVILLIILPHRKRQQPAHTAKMPAGVG